MRRCQTSRQHWVSQLQPHLHGFFQRKSQKPHLEMLGRLIFCVGLTLSKPAWSAPEVGSAALAVSNAENQESVEVTDASTEADAIAKRCCVRVASRREAQIAHPGSLLMELASAGTGLQTLRPALLLGFQP
jgi:hypothetical protein